MAMRNAFRTFRAKGFTIIELMVVISIVATLSVLWVAYGNSYRESQQNSKRIADVATVKSAGDSYYAAKNDYPEPTGNSIYYDVSGTYAHSATGAYGVSSQVTDDLFGAEFLSNVPVDPQTGAAYGYGKRKDGTPGFDIASVDRKGDQFQAYVRGTYDASTLPSLIREYSGPYFVEHGSVEHLPYDPNDRLITAKVSSWSGVVSIIPSKAVNARLVEGDTIIVERGSSATLHLSDGTEAYVGSPDSKTELLLENLEPGGDKGFLTKVRLSLTMGEIGTKAPRLREGRDGRSEFEIASGNAVATVRGTVFGVRRLEGANVTTISLTVGKLSITTLKGDPISIAGSSGPGILEVPEGGTPQRVSMPDARNDAPLPAETASGISWNGPIQMTVPEGFRIWRDSTDTVRVGFKNSSKFTKVGFVVNSIDESRNVQNYDSVLTSGIIKAIDVDARHSTVAFTRDEIDAMDTALSGVSGKSVKLAIVFCRESGSCLRMVRNIPKTGEFDFDESVLPAESVVSCPDGKKNFYKFGCQDRRLVAMATYDQEGNLHMYTELGKKLPLATQWVAASDPEWNAYRSSFLRNAAISPTGGTGSVGFLTSSAGLRGVVLDTSNSTYWGDYDVLEYDLSELGIKSENFMIETDVQGTSLTRTSAKTEGGQGGAFLWSLENGYGAFLEAASAWSGGNAVSIVNESGIVVKSISTGYAVGKNDKRFRLSFESKRSDESSLAAYEDRDDETAERSEKFAAPGGRMIGRLRVGSTFAAYPTNSALPSVCKTASRCQWGGVPSPGTSELIDAVRIYDLSIRRETRQTHSSGDSPIERNANPYERPEYYDRDEHDD